MTYALSNLAVNSVTQNTVTLQVDGTAFESFSDYFIDADGRSVGDHPATTPKTFKTVLEAGTSSWDLLTGTALMHNNKADIVSSIVSSDTGILPEFGVYRTVGTILATPVMPFVVDSYVVRTRVYIGTGVSAVTGIVFAFADSDNFLKLDINHATGACAIQHRDNGVIRRCHICGYVRP